jgi:predicted DNA-binding transcriptional regulator AlpA
MPNIEPPTAQRAATAADPITLRPQGLADRLGVSRRHIYDLIDHPDPARRLPAPFKMGRATFWKMSDISAWVELQAARAAA